VTFSCLRDWGHSQDCPFTTVTWIHSCEIRRNQQTTLIVMQVCGQTMAAKETGIKHLI
jgi:hypothetical protein